MRKRWTQWIRIVVLLLFIAVHIYFSLVHNAWRDEAQCWVLAKNLSLQELMGNLSSEGHPALWFLILRLLICLKLPYICLPLFTTALVCIAAHLLLFKTDLPLPVQLCVMASALFFYYNPIISRNYAAIVLLVTLIAVYWQKRNHKPVLFGMLTALLLQTHVIMAGMGCGLLFIMILQCVRNSRNRMKNKRQILGTGLAFVSLLLLPLELYQRGNVTTDVNSTPSHILSKISLSGLRTSVGVIACDVWKLTPRSVGRGLYWLLLLVVLIALVFFGFLLLKRRQSPLLDILLVSLAGFFGGLFVVVFVYRGRDQMKFTYFLSVLLFASATICQCAKNTWLRRGIAAVVAVMCLGTVPAVIEQTRKDLDGIWTDSRTFQDFVESSLPENSVILVLNHYSAPAAYAYLSDSRPDILFLDMSTREPYKAYFWGEEEPEITIDQWNQTVSSIENNRAVYYLDFELNVARVPQGAVSAENEIYTSLEGQDVFYLWLVREAGK